MNDTITFEPVAKAGIGGDIAEAKADMALKIVSTDGTSYELTSGQNAAGVSNAAQAEMIGVLGSSMIQALPALVDTVIGGYLGAAQLDAQKPAGMTNQEFLIQLLGTLQTMNTGE